MKRFFLAFAWKRRGDEKIPLSSKISVSDNGAIPKSDPPKKSVETPEKMADAKVPYFSTPEKLADAKVPYFSTPEKLADAKVPDLSTPERVDTSKTVSDISSSECEPMSLLRKFAMFLSLDIIVLYFLAFAWLIPCRILDCKFEDAAWKVNMDNISISTNLVVVGPSSSKLLLFGHLEDNGHSKAMTAVKSSTGSVEWRSPIDFKPIHLDCNTVDVNGDGTSDCLVFGKAHLLALNASDGHILWSRKFNRISSLVASVGDCTNEESNWIAVIESKKPKNGYVRDHIQKERITLIILDSNNGTLLSDLILNCDSWPRQLVTWTSGENVTHFSFQCSYNGSTEVKLISGEKLCSLIRGRRVEGFSVLFRFGSSTAVEDVFLLPLSHVGLTVGWSTMVAMATNARSPPRLLWQTSSGSIRSTIKLLSSGYFTSRNSLQIAVVLQDGSSNLVVIIDVHTGKEVARVELGSGSVTSVELVPRNSENADSLLITKEKAISAATRNLTKADAIDSTAESALSPDIPGALRQVKTYLLLTIAKETNVTELLSEERGAEVAVARATCTTILFTATLSNQTTQLSSHVLQGISNNTCSCS